MNSTSVSLREGRWAGFREVMQMSGPIILGSISYTIMQFTDALMVSRLGTDALAAAGSAGIWSYTMGCFFFGLVGCVSTFAAQSVGRGEHRQAAIYAWQGLYLSLGAGVIALALWPISNWLFHIMGHSPEVTRQELAYFQIRLIGYIPMAATTALASFFQSINRPGIPMRAAIYGAVLNIALNYLLIYGKMGFPQWGVGGAAVATIISQYVQLLALLSVFLNQHFHNEFDTRRVFAPDWGRLRELMRIGIPAGMTILMDCLNWGIFTSFVVGRFGAAQLAAHNAAMQFLHLSFMPALGINQGITAIVGQYIGRGDIPRAKARTYTAIRIAMAYMGMVGIGFGVFGGQLIHQFLSVDPEVIKTGRQLLILAGLFQGFDAINVVCFGALRGAGDTRWTFYATLLGAYGFLLPLSMVLAITLDWQSTGAWIGATIYVILLSGLVFHRFYGEKWRHIQIFRVTGS